tara:strand:- start:219 stop:605 length:387 start_codon:yes stop_codon:yes gene_type:complete
MINKMKNVFAPHIDFSFLYGVIPENPKAQPCNIDGLFQRKNKFLVMEWKRPNENMNLGQKILLDALSEQKNFTVILIEGYSQDGKREIGNISVLKNEKFKYHGEGEGFLIQFMQRFYNYANKAGRATP